MHLGIIIQWVYPKANVIRIWLRGFSLLVRQVRVQV